MWDATGPASLASRSHMQRVYSTGERYVTDSFVAGADGTTLNYTVIVPLRDGQGAMPRRGTCTTIPFSSPSAIPSPSA